MHQPHVKARPRIKSVNISPGVIASSIFAACRTRLLPSSRRRRTFPLTSTAPMPQITQEIGTCSHRLLGSCPLWQLPPQMATTLTPVDSREVVRCDRCLLVQFRTSNNLCRRCHLSLDEEEPEIVQAPAPQLVPAAHRGHLNLAASIRAMRLRNGLSQRQLAGRMSVPRTYVSKIENEKATPTLSSLERLAKALEVTVPELLSGGERNRQEEIMELMKDPFIAEMMPFVSQLNGMQMSSILTQIRDLTLRPRRSA